MDDHSVGVLESVLGQIGQLEHCAPDLHAALAESLRESLNKARSNQPVERKLDRLRCLSDKISHRKKQLDKWDLWLQDMQRQIDEGRSKFAALEIELRDYQQERKELLLECNGDRDNPDDGMDEEDEDEEEEAAAKRKKDEAEHVWQEAKSRRLLRAQAKKQAGRSAP